MKTLLLVFIFLLPQLTAKSQIDLCKRGTKDALTYYDDSKAFDAAFFTTLANPIVGIVATISVENRKVKAKNLYIPPTEYIMEDEYRKCYLKESRSMKKRAVWRGFWTGFAVDILAVIVFATSGK